MELVLLSTLDRKIIIYTLLKGGSVRQIISVYSQSSYFGENTNSTQFSFFFMRQFRLKIRRHYRKRRNHGREGIGRHVGTYKVSSMLARAS